MNAPNEGTSLLGDVSGLMAELRMMIEPTADFEWAGSTDDQWWEFAKRSAIIRQQEAVETIIQLSEMRRGHFGVTLLRPAFEELVWIDYLGKNKSLANELIRELTRKELSDSLEAQSDFLSIHEMHSIGFTMRWVKRILPELTKSNDRLKVLGNRLGWRNGAVLPSMAFLCQKTGRAKDYNYIYQATSRYVHFSPHELLRRVWGTHGSVKISSSHFSQFWSDFALYWGLRILIETLCVSDISELRRISENVALEIKRKIELLRQVQVITKSELEKWAEPTFERGR
jgi:hypothetical protein